MEILKVQNIAKSFDGVKAVDDLSFSVKKGTITALIGPNGSGKTVTFNLITGFYTPTAGKIFFSGKDITHLTPHKIFFLGIGRTFQNIRLFPQITVLENILLGIKYDISVYYGQVKAVREGNIKSDIEDVLNLFPALKDKRNQKAGGLSTGEQKLVALGRALMQKPKLLLADEPSLGLSPSYVDTIFEKLAEINKSGTSVLLVEQNARMALEIAHRGYVFKIGSIFLEDTGENLLKSEEVKRAFLGG